MTSPRVLISGAGIAGPSLAYWLSRKGFATTVVERAPMLREGGQAVDFRGPIHRMVLERMGLWEAIHEHQTHLGSHALLDAEGRPCAMLPALMMSGDVEILRGDLCQLLHAVTRESTAYRFGDSITALHDDGAGMEVEFERAAPERFDLVVGADGLHSRVRALAFGEASSILRHQGYRVAGCTIANVLGLRRCGVTYSEPGRGISVTSSRRDDEARALLVYAGPPLGRERRELGSIREELVERFGDMGWRVPQLLAELQRASDLYFDDISTVHLDRYARGRVVLLGDAAYGGTLGGQGTPLAMVGAYVLAGELAATPGDPASAFARYEAHLRPYASKCQKGATHVGGFFAPKSRLGLALRNQLYRLLASRPLETLFEKLVTQAAEGIALPEYAA